MLGGIIAATDETTFLQASAAAQKRITEQAYVVFLYAPSSYLALNNRVQNAAISPITGRINLFDAYIGTSTP
jgi:ABC-type transport system substrate-binding protein